jgi:hypothetical protein
MTTSEYGMKRYKTDAGFANEIVRVSGLLPRSSCVRRVGVHRVRDYGFRL